MRNKKRINIAIDKVLLDKVKRLKANGVKLNISFIANKALKEIIEYTEKSIDLETIDIKLNQLENLICDINKISSNINELKYDKGISLINLEDIRNKIKI